MRDQTILRTFAQQARVAESEAQQRQDLYRAVNTFMSMPFLERVGWVVLGPRWLTKRWTRKAPGAHPPRPPR